MINPCCERTLEQITKVLPGASVRCQECGKLWKYRAEGYDTVWETGKETK